MMTTKKGTSNLKKAFFNLKTGDYVLIDGPYGIFTLQEDYSKPVVLLGGGIGITPFRCFIKYATDKKLPVKITLFYSNKTKEDIVYKKEFDLWNRKNKNLKIVYVVGRISEEIVREHVDEIQNSIFYICGPPTMVDGMKSMLKNMEVPKANVKVEEFTGY